MKSTLLKLSFPVLLSVAMLTGCATQSGARSSERTTMSGGPDTIPSSPTVAYASGPNAARPVSTAATSTAAVAGGNSTEGGTPLSTEAAEFVARFTQQAGGETLPHQLTDTTSFPEAIASLQAGARAPKFEYLDSARTVAPVQGLTADGNSTQLIVRDWTGLVLVPISTSLSVAHTSSVRLLKVEAHPLADGRVRIWVRVRNSGRQDIMSEVACSFRTQVGRALASPYFYELPVPSGDYRDVFFVSPEGMLTSYTVLVRQGR